MEERRRKKSGFFKMLLIVVLIVVAILAVSLAIRASREGGLGGLWSSLTSDEMTDAFYYDNASGGTFKELDGGLAVMSTSGLYVFNAEGEQEFSRLFTYGYPAMGVTGKYGAAYNIGGSEVIFFSSDGVISEIKTEYPIISAGVNGSGYLTVCTEESGYYGSVTVYNSGGTAIYRWHAGSGRILSATVGGDSELLILTVGEGGSRLVLNLLSSEEMKAEYVYPGLVIDARFTDGGVTAVTTTSVISLSSALEERAVYDFGGRYLEAYDIEDDYTALALSDFQVGGGRTLVTVTDGTERGSGVLTNDIVALDARGGRVAVLCTGYTSVYNSNAELLFGFESDAASEAVLIRSDSSVITAGAFSAYVHKNGNE